VSDVRLQLAGLAVSLMDATIYLGDGVFVALEGTDLVLTTSTGAAVTNRIVLEPEVLANLVTVLEAFHGWQAPWTTQSDE
jgi:hypothetical protein